MDNIVKQRNGLNQRRIFINDLTLTIPLINHVSDFPATLAMSVIDDVTFIDKNIILCSVNSVNRALKILGNRHKPIIVISCVNDKHDILDVCNQVGLARKRVNTEVQIRSIMRISHLRKKNIYKRYMSTSRLYKYVCQRITKRRHILEMKNRILHYIVNVSDTNRIQSVNIKLNDKLVCSLNESNWALYTATILNTFTKKGYNAIVHCHAGISRSPTVILIAQMLNDLSNNSIKPFDTYIVKLREQRECIEVNISFHMNIYNIYKQITQSSFDNITHAYMIAQNIWSYAKKIK